MDNNCSGSVAWLERKKHVQVYLSSGKSTSHCSSKLLHCAALQVGLNSKIARFYSLHMSVRAANWNKSNFEQNFIAKVCFAQRSTSRLALGSPGWSVGRHHAQNIFKTLIMLYFWKAQGPRTSKLIFPTVKYTNTHIQIHKYSLWRSARNTKHMLYF